MPAPELPTSEIPSTCFPSPANALDTSPDSHFLEEDLAKYCSGPLSDILHAMLRSPQDVEAAKFTIASHDEVVASPDGSMTRLDWLKRVAAATASSGKGCSERFEAFLHRKHGPTMMPVETGRGTSWVFNSINYAALFLIYHQIEYDVRIGSFCRYDDNKGIWSYLPEEKVIQLLITFTRPRMVKHPKIYSSRPSFYRELISHCKSLGLVDERRYRTNLLAIKNGTLDIVANKVSGHSPAYKLTNHIAIEYTPPTGTPNSTETCPSKFLSFLHNIMDKADVNLLQYWCGAVLLGRNPFHNILIISGEAGAGKSTFLDIIEGILGRDNVATLTTERLEERFELSEFLGKTLLVARDASVDFLSNRSAYMLKTLSGDSGIKAEVKNVQKRVTIGGPFNIAIACNSELVINLSGDAGAWSRRLLIIDVKRKERRIQIPDFAKCLIEEEGSKIFTWILEGVRKVQYQERIGRPFPLDNVQLNRIKVLLGKSDSLGDFVRGKVVRMAENSISTSDLYDEYLNFCSFRGNAAAHYEKFARNIGPLMARHHQSIRRNIPSKTTHSGFQKGFMDVAFSQEAPTDKAGPITSDS